MGKSSVKMFSVERVSRSVFISSVKAVRQAGSCWSRACLNTSLRNIVMCYNRFLFVENDSASKADPGINFVLLRASQQILFLSRKLKNCKKPELAEVILQESQVINSTRTAN